MNLSLTHPHTTLSPPNPKCLIKPQQSQNPKPYPSIKPLSYRISKPVRLRTVVVRTVGASRGGYGDGREGEREDMVVGEMGFVEFVGSERFRVVAMIAVALVLCNVDRVVMSVAIVPLSLANGWSQSFAGVVQSSFLWGYLISPIAGGTLVDYYGGKVVLACGVGLWSLATFLTPKAAKTSLWALLGMRVLVGVAEGVALPCMNNMILRMSNLVSTWSRNLKTIPDSYIFSPGERPGDHVVPICKSIPVVNLALNDRCEIARQMVNASEEYGLFQVVNHGVSENLMKRTANLFEEFFNMTEEEKASFYTDDIKSTTKLYTSSLRYSKDKVHAWRDVLNHSCSPLEDHIHNWPDKPAGYREVVGEYAVAVKKLSSVILQSMAEGLGLEGDYFETKLTERHSLVVNNYPPCPNPSLVWGNTAHVDPSIITILQQNVYGLQIKKDGEWIGVELIPNAFVVNGGYHLEAITNGKLKSTLHRVIANSDTGRMSMANLINPSMDSFILPAKGLIDADNPPKYKDYNVKELMETYFDHYGNPEAGWTETYKLQ